MPRHEGILEHDVDRSIFASLFISGILSHDSITNRNVFLLSVPGVTWSSGWGIQACASLHICPALTANLTHTVSKCIESINLSTTVCLHVLASVLKLSGCLQQQVPWVRLDDSHLTYEPAAYFNDFWTLRDYLIPVNGSLPELQVTLALNSVGQMKWMMYLQTEQSFR